MHWKCQKKCQMLKQKMKDLKLLIELWKKKKITQIHIDLKYIALQCWLYEKLKYKTGQHCELLYSTEKMWNFSLLKIDV